MTDTTREGTPAPECAASEPSSRFAALSERVREAMERLHVPGVAVGVLYDGKEEAAGFGVTSVEHPLPVDPNTLFQIGSITKTVTATAIMRLAERGALALDAPVRSYIPDLRLADEGTAAHVTVRQLLNHTSGWAGDFFVDTGNGDDALARVVARLTELPQLTPLGRVWSYNNAAFYIAGRVVEVVTGQTFEAAARELVLEPLGMRMSHFSPQDVMTHRFAVGHLVREERPMVARPWPLTRATNPAGGVSSTACDLLRYARFHTGDGTVPGTGDRLLATESMAEMQTPAVATDCFGGMVGIAWMLKDVSGLRLARHGGATHGQMASLVLVASRGFAIVVLTNSDRGSALHGELTKWALQEYLGVSEPEPTPSDLPVDALERFVGRYVGAMATDDVEISRTDTGLVLQVHPKPGFPISDSPARPAPPPTRLVFCGDGAAQALDRPLMGSRVEFLCDGDGAVAWLRMGGRVRARQH